MHKNLDGELRRIAASTFEGVGFLFVEPELTDRQRGATVDATARVAFHGPRHGTVELWIAGGILPTLTAGMLGQAQPPDRLVQQDALGEVANTICGQVLPYLAAPDAVFTIFPPECGTVSESGDVPPLAHASIGIDDGRADIRLYVDGEG